MNWEETVIFYVGLLAVIEPFSSLAMFNGLTAKYPEKYRKLIALFSAMAIAGLLLGAAWAGDFIIELFGISVAAIRVAGGLILLPSGLSMVKGDSSEALQKNDIKDFKKSWKSAAIVPIAIPATIDGASIAMVITQVTKFNTNAGIIWISIVILAISLTIGILYFCSSWIQKIIGPTGMNIITRLSGLIVTAIAVTAIISGLKELLPGLN